MYETIVTALTICLLNDDEIQLDSIHTRFYVITKSGKAYNEKDMPLDELFNLLAHNHVFSIWVPDFPQLGEDAFGEEVELTDDFLIFPQGIAHIEADASTVEV